MIKAGIKNYWPLSSALLLRSVTNKQQAILSIVLLKLIEELAQNILAQTSFH